jgi:hypothetical protein
MRSTPQQALDEVAAVAHGARVLHIGPSKTGTTALQGACWHARAALEQQGLLYAGGARHAQRPSHAVVRRGIVTGNESRVPSIRWWKALVREMRGTRLDRAFYSSETLAHADEQTIRRILDDLGPSLHVLVTLRSLDAILPSLWQQGIQAGGVRPLDEYLERMLGRRGPIPDASLWFRHDHGALVGRWASIVGADLVTVLVVDPDDRDFLFRASEAILGLASDTLRPVDTLANRSLTAGETEVIRRMNLLAREAGIGPGARYDLVLAGAATNVKRRPATAGAERVHLPAWAVERIFEVANGFGEQIRSSGVRVVGDLARLDPKPASAARDVPVADGVVEVDAETAAALAMGVAWGTGLRLGPGQPASDGVPIRFVTTRQLVRLVLGRGRLWLVRQLRLASLRKG